MIPEGPPTSCSVGVLGSETIVETLSAVERTDGRSLEVVPVTSEAVRHQEPPAQEVDCLIIDDEDSSDGGVAVLEAIATARPELPAVFLVDEVADGVVADALSAGAADVLPRTVALDRPELFCERVLGRVEGRQRQESFRELYDNLAGVVTVHDPASGELVHANQTLCDLLGYDRDEVLAMTVSDFTADVPGYNTDRATNVAASVSEQNAPIEVEWPITTADDSVRWIESRFQTATFGGREIVLSTSVDVTERRRQERKYEQVFDNVNDVITVHDPWEGELVDVNQRLCELTGYSREALLEMGVDGFSATAEGYTSDRAYDIQQTVAATGESETVDWVVETADGEQRRLETVLSPTTIAGEDRVLVLARDVTKRRRLEQTYRDLFESVSDGLVVHDPETGEIRDVNDRYCELTGYDREELVGSNVRLIVPDDSESSFEDAMERIERARENGPQLFEFEGQRKDGSTFAGEINLSTVDIRGEERVLASVRDITERRQLERTYRSVFESVSDGLVIHDPDTGEIIDANDRFCEMNGYDREELVGETVGLISGPDHTYEHAQERIAAAREEPQLFEWENQTKDGTTFPVEVHLSVVDIHGEERVLGSVRDITERKRREREYEQIFNSVQDGILIFDPETLDILDANETYLDMLGYENLESIRQQGVEGLSATTEGYTVEEGAQVHRRVAETGEPEIVEWGAETKSGERRWLEVKVAPAVIGGEEVTVAINRDVTERKRREREYEQIFNAVNDIVNVYDPETGDLVDVNETMCELTGYDRETLLERGLGAVSVTDEGFTGKRAKRIIAEVMDSGEPRTLEWQLEAADGDRIWLDVKATPATIGGEDRLLTISRDVTERRRTKRRLEEILDRIDEAIFMTRAEEITSASRAPDYVSSGYEEIWGQPLEAIRETYEEGFFGTLHPDDAPEYRAFVEGVIDDIAAGTAADSYSLEYRIERPDGEVRWVHSDYYPTTWEGAVPRIIIVSRDVSDRKARERRMASFEDATDDLATADTPAEATRTAVEAASEVLELPAVGAFLYDDDGGVLTPEVHAGPLPDALAESSIGPGDGPLWESFATGTVVTDQGEQRDGTETGGAGTTSETDRQAPLDALTEWRALALGNHGILLVGSPDSSLSGETIQMAHVLAATLEAALNHLEGQAQLAAQEEQLQTQTERVQRLDRIARLTQQVEAAITNASNAAEVQQAVCERLATSGPYDLAWIGGVEVGTDRLTARAISGASTQYVAAMDLTTRDDTADPHPAVAAWRTNEVCVANSLVGDGLAADWRQHGLSEGYQSLCAVPVSHDGITHGVLTVGTDSPNAFGDREQEVLAQLGTSIADALAAIQRRRALESDETVELEFHGSGESLSLARAATAADCEVRHERTAAREDGSVSVYVSFQGPVSGDIGGIASRTLPGSVDVVSEETSSTIVEARTDDWFGSPLAEYGGVLREARAEPGETTIAVEVPQQTDVRSFADRLQTVAPSLELVARRQHSRADRTPAELSEQIQAELTDRQFEVLQTALAAGYFEWPRDNDGSDVADRLDITQPTLNKHLRIAEKKTFTLLFDSDA